MNKSIALIIAATGFVALGLSFLPGCASTGPASKGAILTDASTLVTQLQKAAPSVTTPGSKTAADVNAGLWAASTIIQDMQGQPLTAATLDTGIPAVNQVLQANLGSGSATVQDVQKIQAVIAALPAS